MPPESERLQEFAARCAALPDNMRAFVECTDLGLRLWLEARAAPGVHLHVQRLVGWPDFRDAVPNPLVIALNKLLVQATAEVPPEWRQEV